MFLQNIVWKRLNVQEGGKTRLLEEERVICFCPIMLLKTQCCSWCIWTLNTSQNQEHNGKPCKDNNRWHIYGQTLCWKHHVRCPHTCHFTSIFLVMRKPKPDTDECRWASTIRPDSFQWIPPSPDGQLPGEHRSRLEFLILSAFNCKPPACFKMKPFPCYDLTNFNFLNVVSILPLLNLVNNTQHSMVWD